MPNPWESSSFQLKSTLNSAGASLMPPARLSDVMLLPRRSNWQARVHDKFEGSTSGFGQDGEGGDAEIEPRRPCLHLTPRLAGEGGACKLSNGRIAQFLCSSFARRQPRRTLDQEFTCSGDVPGTGFYCEEAPKAAPLSANFRARCRWSSILGSVRCANALSSGSAPFWISYRNSAALPF